jgi:hypothetical protein
MWPRLTALGPPVRRYGRRALAGLAAPEGYHADHIGMIRGVAYLGAADNVSGPLPLPLREGNQPVIRTRNGFSRPRPALLAL